MQGPVVGHKRIGGRRPGSRNKVTADLRKLLLGGAQRAGNKIARDSRYVSELAGHDATLHKCTIGYTVCTNIHQAKSDFPRCGKWVGERRPTVLAAGPLKAVFLIHDVHGGHLP
jgi:hypothetical protein